MSALERLQPTQHTRHQKQDINTKSLSAFILTTCIFSMQKCTHLPHCVNCVTEASASALSWTNVNQNWSPINETGHSAMFLYFFKFLTEPMHTITCPVRNGRTRNEGWTADPVLTSLRPDMHDSAGVKKKKKKKKPTWNDAPCAVVLFKWHQIFVINRSEPFSYTSGTCGSIR